MDSAEQVGCLAPLMTPVAVRDCTFCHGQEHFADPRSYFVPKFAIVSGPKAVWAEYEAIDQGNPSRAAESYLGKPRSRPLYQFCCKPSACPRSTAISSIPNPAAWVMRVVLPKAAASRMARMPIRRRWSVCTQWRAILRSLARMPTTVCAWPPRIFGAWPRCWRQKSFPCATPCSSQCR